MGELPGGQQVFALACEALRYGLSAVGGDAPFQPALVTESANGERRLTQLVLLNSDHVLRDSRAQLNQMSNVRRAALVMDGSVEVSDEPQDALIVHVAERGFPTHYFLQRYRRKRFGKGITTVGNIGYGGEVDALFD